MQLPKALIRTGTEYTKIDKVTPKPERKDRVWSRKSMHVIKHGEELAEFC